MEEYFLIVEQTVREKETIRLQLKCNQEVYQQTEIGDIVNCDRTQSVLTRRGTAHRIEKVS